jgi:hypothetical protein
MKKNVRFPIRQLLRIHFLLLLTSSVRTVPITNTASGLNFDFLANVSDKKEQIKQELEWSKKDTEPTKERLHILDQLILGDAEDLLSSGADNLPETSPTAGGLVPGQTDSTSVELQELTPVSEDVDAELMQV